MSTQIAVRLPDDVLAQLDAGVAVGRYRSRAEAVRTAIEWLLKAEREREIALEYRRAYGHEPQEDWVGEAGLAFMAQVLVAETSEEATAGAPGNAPR